MANTTYSSGLQLNKGTVAQMKDKIAYREMLDLHDAIEALAGRLESVAGSSGIAEAYVLRRLASVTVSADYTALPEHGMVRIDAATGDIDITMPPVADILGYEFILKRIDTVGANAVTIFGDGTELIDGALAGISLAPMSSYTIKAHGAGWDII